MFQCCRFVIVILLIFPFFSQAQLSDESFSQVRSEIASASKKSPLLGIEKADELISVYGAQLAPHQRIRILYLKSWYQINADRVEAAIGTLSKARLLAQDIEEPGILYSYYSISASVFSHVELYELALENNLKAYELAPLLGQKQFIHQTENNIGDIYLKLGLFDKAERYFKRFYTSALTLGQYSQQGTGLNNLGEVAYFKGDYDAAQSLHEQALAIRQQNGFNYHESWSLYNLGRVHAKKENFAISIRYLAKSIDNWSQQSAHSKTIQPRLALAKVFSEQGRIVEARRALDEVIDIGERFQLYTPLQEALILKSKLMRESGELASALDTLDRHNIVAKKFTDKQAAIGLAYMVSQTELHTKEAALKQLEQQHQLTLSATQSERLQGVTLLLSAIIIICISSFFLYRLNCKKKQLQTLVTQLETTQEKLVESEKMRAMTTLVSGMAHQLNTPLGLVVTANSTLQSQVNILTKQFADHTLTQTKLAEFIGKSTELLDLSQKNSEKAADLIQRFKMMSSELQICELNSFLLLTFLQEKMDKIIPIYGKNITFSVHGENIKVTNYMSVLLKVLTQLVENSVKHGFNDVLEPTIDISVIHNGEAKCVIHYKDNGIGIAKEKRKQVFDPFYTTSLGDGSLGLGLNIIYNSVVHIMHGQVECIDETDGAHFSICIPTDITATLKQGMGNAN